MSTRTAARAIIIENGKMLVMHRNKQGSEYFTLVGGRVNDGETIEQALIREVREETGFEVTQYRLVYYEDHPAPYNEQYIFLCDVASHGEVAIQEYSEEHSMNRMALSTHTPMWVETRAFAMLHFRTPQLYEAIIKALKKGFPKEPVRL
jgi:ADP-ribose pyrophosphatase YjhB (NUDIX family)